MRRLALMGVLPAMLFAQDTVAPATDSKVGKARGTEVGNYNLTQSWEARYRFASIGGDEGKYRSDVNYSNGIRLLSSSLSLHSKDGKGRLFDQLTLFTQGLGNDPYESATVRLEKNRWYRYDLLWRQNDYRNPGLVTSNGTHLENTTHRWQDHDVTLFPQRHYRLRAGYSRVKQAGPALASTALFDGRSDVYPVFRNIYRQFDDYRVGGDIDFKGFRLTLQKRWEFYKEDTQDDQTLAERGTAPATLQTFRNAAPYRGQTPSWMGNLFGEHGWFLVNGRFTYASTVGDFIQSESAIGTDRFGSAQNRQILVRGRGNRPVMTGDFTVSLFPAARVTITNHTAASSTRMVGNNFYQQYDNSAFSFSSLAFQTLNLRLVTNATDVRFRVTKTFDVTGGFRYSDREIQSIENSQITGSPWDGATFDQYNRTKAGFLSLNWLPVKNLRLHAESEFGVNDNPFTPISQRDFHTVRARAQYRAKKFTLGTAYADNYNSNSISITTFSARARNYSADASLNATSWMSIDGSWSKLHQDTAGGLNFFAGAPRATLVTGLESIYISNLHAGNVGARFTIRQYADLYVGYNITRDTGDGRSTLATQPTAAAQVFYSVQTFPLTFQTPLARVSVRITDKVRWNVGWQYYGYREKFGVLSLNQGYRANTGYTSLLWAF